jgi:zinc D-Ala-D-Ala carboxypeptidase
MNLTEHWTLEELVRSSNAVRHGIDNTPPPWAIENLRQLAIHSLEPARTLLGKPISPDSGYRCPALNVIVGGVNITLPDGSIDWDRISQHVKGEAADLLPPAGMTVEDFFEFLAKNVPFDQLIQEGHWVHISWRQNCRGQMLQATFDANGHPTYTPRFVEGVKT